MAILNLGSINIDHVYRVPHLPTPGETIAALSYQFGLGGKGANQSIAAARAGATVRHIGAIGPDCDWAVNEMALAGVSTKNILVTDVPSGHAVINVDQAAENVIILFPGANNAITKPQIDTAIAESNTGDWLILQNETNLGAYAVEKARAAALKIAYSAAPFDERLVAKILPFIDLLVVNEIELQQITDHIADAKSLLENCACLVTLGAAGAQYSKEGNTLQVPAFPAKAIDTTGAGDTYLGYFIAALDQGMDIKSAMRRAAMAGSIQVTRRGAAEVIPELSEVLAAMEI